MFAACAVAHNVVVAGAVAAGAVTVDDVVERDTISAVETAAFKTGVKDDDITMMSLLKPKSMLPPPLLLGKNQT